MKMLVCIINYIVNGENGVFFKKKKPMGAFIRVKKIKLAALRSIYVFINCSLLLTVVGFFLLFKIRFYVVFMF